LIDDRADAITDLTTQPQKIEAGFVVDQYCDAHFGLVDIRQCVIQRLRWAGFDAGDVFTHLTRDVACIEIRRTGGNRRFRLGQLQRVIRAVADTKTAANTGAEKIILWKRARWTQRQCRQGF
jgi:hypothetical protein